MANSGKLIPSSGTQRWDFYDDFIEDGSLVSIVKIYRMENGKTELIFNFRESLTPDDQGNIRWNFVWRYRDVKITKVMRAQRVHNREREMFSLNVLLLVYTILVYCVFGIDDCSKWQFVCLISLPHLIIMIIIILLASICPPESPEIRT